MREEKYNPKNYYLICRTIASSHISSNENIAKDEQRSRDIYNEILIPDNEYEKNILLVKEILIDNNYKYINEKIIKKIYYKITNDILTLDINKLLDIINSDSLIYKKIYLVMKEIIFENIFKDNQNIMERILMNLILKINDYNMIIPYYFDFEAIKKAIILNYQEVEIINKIRKLDLRTKENNVYHDISLNKKNLGTLREIAETLKNKFNLDSIFIVGSMLNEVGNIFSDLDIIIILNNCEIKDNVRYLILNYLYKFINIKIDLILTTKDSMDIDLTIDMRRTMKKII